MDFVIKSGLLAPWLSPHEAFWKLFYLSSTSRWLKPSPEAGSLALCKCYLHLTCPAVLWQLNVESLNFPATLARTFAGLITKCVFLLHANKAHSTAPGNKSSPCSWLKQITTALCQQGQTLCWGLALQEKNSLSPRSCHVLLPTHWTVGTHNLPQAFLWAPDSSGDRSKMSRTDNEATGRTRENY